MKIERTFVQENKNRKFYAIKVDGTCIATYIWQEAVADILLEALADYTAKHGDDALLQAIQEAA